VSAEVGSVVILREDLVSTSTLGKTQFGKTQLGRHCDWEDEDTVIGKKL
jgi:hypothetical protein